MDEKVGDLKLKMNKQDEIVQDTRKAADTILLILDKKEIREKKASCLGKQSFVKELFLLHLETFLEQNKC